MDDRAAIQALSALAQEHRLAVFRMLVKSGPSGLAAGAISERLGVMPSALSFHLSHLERAGMLHSWRDGRHVRYAVRVERVRQLLAFLTEDCCQGHPELCGGLTALAAVCTQ
jgi:DNA-binding transcriptional ArsR family regulator